MKRRSIRHTWARAEGLSSVKIVFILASSTNSTIQGKAELEAELFKDILMVDYVDHYRNLSYKNILGLKYASQLLETSPEFIVKADDDFFYDLYELFHFFHEKLVNSKAFMSGNAIACQLIPKSRVFRDFTSTKRISKWAVTEESLPSSRLIKKKFYPPYCHGCLYLLTPATAVKLLEFVSQEPHYISVDDAWVTGLVAREANISHIAMESVLTFSESQFLKAKKNQNTVEYNRDYIVGPLSPRTGYILQSRARWCWIHKCRNNIYRLSRGYTENTTTITTWF